MIRSISVEQFSDSYVSNIELVAWILRWARESVATERLGRWGSMKTLSCHRHSNLPWNRSCTEACLILTILERKETQQLNPTTEIQKTYLANENRAAEQRLL